jgi:hypothetical protein
MRYYLTNLVSDTRLASVTAVYHNMHAHLLGVGDDG